MLEVHQLKEDTEAIEKIKEYAIKLNQTDYQYLRTYTTSYDIT